MKIQTNQTTTLIDGCELLSKRLRTFGSPMGLLFKFNVHHRPKPLAITVVLMIFCSLLALLMLDFVLINNFTNPDDNFSRFDEISQSPFIMRLLKFFETYRLCIYTATFVITIAQHGSMVNVMAINNNFVSQKEQHKLAGTTSTVFLFKVLTDCFLFVSVLGTFNLLNGWRIYVASFCVGLIMFLELTVFSPIMYTCYLGASLGKHVENFSTLYIDSMFDQFMSALDKDNSSPGQTSIVQLDSVDEDENEGCLWCCCAAFGFLERVWVYIVDHSRRIGEQLNSKKYPELPEMKMTKLSSSSSFRISDSMRNANGQLIRIRLKKTQIMLTELRDMVSDVNKMSSPIIMMHILYETFFIILISTSSIQAKLFKSINLLIVPTVANTIALVIVVVHICTCLDDTTGQLQLMINKLFDFIIMNHRVQTNYRCDHFSAQEKRILASEKENEALSETWSQFQYTRKLANTIQFTMGGILPVTRRLVLLILGHILSAVFISIEIMSIVDTSDESNTGVVPSALITTISGHHNSTNLHHHN